MSGIATAIIGGAVVGGLASNSAANKSANAQTSAAKTAADTQMNMFNTTNAQQAPWRQAGGTAIGQLSAGTAPGGQFTQTFNNSDLNSQLAPNYQFQLGQGLGALNNQNSVTGGLVSGNALQGAEGYAQNYAGNAYQNAFNNWNTQQSNIFNRLSSIAGTGQTSVGQTGQAATAAGGNIGSAQLASGAAQAAGYIGQGNAISGIGNAISGYGMYSGLNKGGGGFDPSMLGSNSSTFGDAIMGGSM